MLAQMVVGMDVVEESSTSSNHVQHVLPARFCSCEQPQFERDYADRRYEPSADESPNMYTVTISVLLPMFFVASGVDTGLKRESSIFLQLHVSCASAGAVSCVQRRGRAVCSDSELGSVNFHMVQGPLTSSSGWGTCLVTDAEPGQQVRHVFRAHWHGAAFWKLLYAAA